jgi:capsid protein
MVIEAYSKCRFIGKNMPHIDPLKEAKSVELMLNLGLVSREQATEMLNLGDWYENYLKLQEENNNVIVAPKLTE